LRNAAATFGTESAQYKSVLSMVESYISGPKVQDFAPLVERKVAPEPKQDTTKTSETTPIQDASTAPDTAHTFTLSNLVYRPKQK
jgi:hypothetical protein